MNFQQILDCFIPNFKLKYEDSENIEADHVNTVVFNLHQIKQEFFFGTPSTFIVTFLFDAFMISWNQLAQDIQYFDIFNIVGQWKVSQDKNLLSD